MNTTTTTAATRDATGLRRRIGLGLLAAALAIVLAACGADVAEPEAANDTTAVADALPIATTEPVTVEPEPADEPAAAQQVVETPEATQERVAAEPVVDNADVALIGAFAQAIEAGTDGGQLSADESACAAEGFIATVGTELFSDSGITSETMPAFADLPFTEEDGIAFFDATLECIGATELFVRDMATQLGADGSRCVADEAGDEAIAVLAGSRGGAVPEETIQTLDAAMATCGLDR